MCNSKISAGSESTFKKYYVGQNKMSLSGKISFLASVSSNTVTCEHYLVPQLNHNPFVYRNTHFVCTQTSPEPNIAVFHRGFHRELK